MKGIKLMIVIKACLILTGFLCAGCCLPSRSDRVQHKRPATTREWKVSTVGSVTTVAELVLSKGEHSVGENLRVQVIDIIAPDRCAEPNSYPGRSKVVLRFGRKSDQAQHCDFTFMEGGNRLDKPECSLSFGLAAITIHAINPDEKWVWFELIA